jgi:hypothetical protein
MSPSGAGEFSLESGVGDRGGSGLELELSEINSAEGAGNGDDSSGGLQSYT